MNELIGAVFSQSARTHIDLCNRRELLEKNLNRIFAGQGIVELWEHEKESVAIHELTFPSSEAFRTNHMARDPQSLGNCFFFIFQGHSWSRLHVSAELLLQILVHHNISPFLLDFVHCFGAKVTGEDNPYYGTFYATISLPHPNNSTSSGQHYDFSYLLRRYENHGNGQMKDPWSLRQMTICQRYNFETQKSTWILIKPFQHCQSQLRTLILDNCLNHPMALHLLFLTMATENWRWYIDFLRRRLAEFTEKATFSSFNSTRMNYDIKFADSQRLHALESKMTVAVAVLEQNIAIGSGMKSHCQRLERLPNLAINRNMEHAVEDDIEMQLSHLKLHKISCELLLRQLHGTCTLILKVLDCRNDLVMEDYSRVAAELAQTNNAQNNTLNIIARATKRDSRMMKVLTVIAIAYVPASVIASIFSSGLITTSDQSLPANSFHISKDLWIFVLSSLVVTTFTISMAFWWTGRGE